MLTIHNQTRAGKIFKCTIFVGYGGVIFFFWCHTLTKNGVGTLICTCWKYSCKWRFLYSCGDVGKSYVKVYSGKQDTGAFNRTWKDGNSFIRETSKYKHLQTKRMYYPGNVTNTIHALRGTFLSLQSCGAHSNGINPILSI